MTEKPICAIFNVPREIVDITKEFAEAKKAAWDEFARKVLESTKTIQILADTVLKPALDDIDRALFGHGWRRHQIAWLQTHPGVKRYRSRRLRHIREARDEA